MLVEKQVKHRQMQKIPLIVADGEKIKLTPSAHCELIEQIMEFALRFTPGAEVIYVGDTRGKLGYFQEARPVGFGVTVDQHGKMPVLVFYFYDKG